MAEKQKAKYWTAILYPENMKDGWQDEIGDLLEYPGEYCIHDKCHLVKSKGQKDYERKPHVHVVLCFNNTTTERNAYNLFDKLSADGKCCLPQRIETVHNIRHMHDYLIHDTKSCKDQNKHLYSADERHTFNNFDVGMYEQLSIADKRKMQLELCNFIVDNNIMNFSDFFSGVCEVFSDEYTDIIFSNSGLFDRLCRGQYHKMTSSIYVDKRTGEVKTR